MAAEICVFPFLKIFFYDKVHLLLPSCNLLQFAIDMAHRNS